MLHVIWILIKIILLILAVLLGIAVILLLAVLLVPVRYQASGKKDETEAAEAHIRLSWMGSLLNLPVSYKDGVFSAKLRIWRISVFDFFEEEDFIKEDFAEEAFGEENFTEEVRIEKDLTEKDFAEDVEEKAFTKEKENEETSVKRKKAKCTLERLCDKIKRMGKKYKRARKFAEDERTKAAFCRIKKEAFYVLSALKPRKAEGWLRFGTEDPALTGELLGVISIFYPFSIDTVQIIPDFQRAVLEGNLFVRGKFHLIRAVRAAWKLFRDKNVRWAFHTFKLL